MEALYRVSKDWKDEDENSYWREYGIMKVIHIIKNKRQHLNLLLLADPSEKMINLYLEKGEMYAVLEKGKVVSIAVMVHLEKGTCELKNIATLEGYQNKGFAKALINYLCKLYSKQYNTMLVGTTETTSAFYKRLGFKYAYTIPNFFVRHYERPIFEDERQCIDMLYYEKQL